MVERVLDRERAFICRAKSRGRRERQGIPKVEGKLVVLENEIAVCMFEVCV